MSFIVHPVRFVMPALLCVGCLTLSGCFDLEQTFVVNDRGVGAFNLSFQLDGELVELTEESDIDLEGSCDDDEVSIDLPEGLTRVSDVRVEDGVLYCDYAITGPVDRFEELSAKLKQEDNNADIMEFTLLEGTRARLVSRYQFDGDDGADEAGQSAIARSIRRMIAANFEGHAIRWTVHAPTILESNGNIASDGRSVTWEIPLQQAVAEGGEWRFEAIIDYRHHTPPMF